LEHITDDDWDGVLARDPDGRGDIDQLIIGDESGGNRRPLDVDWVRTARDAAHRHGVAFHLKQLHVGGKKVHLPILDGRKHDSVPE
jgi:protein gp37